MAEQTATGSDRDGRVPDYDTQAVETKWQQRWVDEGTYQVDNDDPRPKYYVLNM